MSSRARNRKFALGCGDLGVRAAIREGSDNVQCLQRVAKEDSMTRTKWIVWAATLAIVPCTASAQAVLVERTISFAAAQEAATAALERCRKDGYRVTVTVLDRAAQTKVVLHDDGANPHTIENSLRKAYTALTFRVPSGEFGARVASNPGLAGVLHLDKITTL